MRRFNSLISCTLAALEGGLDHPNRPLPHVMMNTQDDIPFQTVLGPLHEGVPQVTAPEISIPDCVQILQETQYEFSLEKCILSEHERPGVPPSCPPHWLLFNDSLNHHRLRLSALSPRPRSYSLNSADSWQQHRNIRFLMCDSNEESYKSDVHYEESPGQMRERPQSAAPQVKEVCGGATRPQSLLGLKVHRNWLPSLHQCRPSSAEHRPQQASPLPQKNKKHHRSRKYPQNPAPVGEKRPQEQRPSSAGPMVKHHRQKDLNLDVHSGGFLDTAAELLSALSQEEQQLLQIITQRGYTLQRAVMALDRTGYRSPEKILKYLGASEWLCQLGYDEGQVEEALEVFQNCESKAAEFLQLLTQFKEMGFQQSAIKEVLLVHENHREKALEDLMTNTG